MDHPNNLGRSTAAPLSLAALRGQIDALDDRLHDLLMERAKLIESVARDGGKTGAKIRPGREAAMLRRLLARHQGAMPAQTLVRLWRELFGGALMIEGGQTVAVCDGDNGSDRVGADRVALAREHFGPLTPLRRCHNPGQTLADLARETAQVAVLPPLGDGDDPAGGWWASLTTFGPHRFSVIGKLPFVTRRPEGAPLGEAYVVAAMRPDASGQDPALDRGLILLELRAELSRARMIGMMTGAGFAPGQIWLKRADADGGMRVLVEVEGLVDDDDPRLAAVAGLEGVAGPAAVLGGFAVPLGEDV
jgi:chorismate mutase